jgi:hypothetical protein
MVDPELAYRLDAMLVLLSLVASLLVGIVFQGRGVDPIISSGIAFLVSTGCLLLLWGFESFTRQ